MKIEEEIQSINFEDNYQRAVTNIHYTCGWFNNVLRGEMKTRDFLAGNLSEEEAETLSNLLDKVRG
jgi:hypothetical protein